VTEVTRPGQWWSKYALYRVCLRKTETQLAEHTDERRNDRPEVIVRPAKANDDEELPLVPSHPDVLNLVTC
jgi:hypothetical protein